MIVWLGLNRISRFLPLVYRRRMTSLAGDGGDCFSPRTFLLCLVVVFK